MLCYLSCITSQKNFTPDRFCFCIHSDIIPAAVNAELSCLNPYFIMLYYEKFLIVKLRVLSMYINCKTSPHMGQNLFFYYMF